MSLRSIGAKTLLAAAVWCAAPLALAQDATLKQVQQAAESGKFIDAQAMLDKVLRAHPNSGKVHFIAAELLARQGQFAMAGVELANAERLAPGLPFARPEALQTLRALVAGTPPLPVTFALAPVAAPDLSYERQVPLAAPAGGAIPSGMLPLLLPVGGLAFAVFAFLRHRAGRRVAAQ